MCDPELIITCAFWSTFPLFCEDLSYNNYCQHKYHDLRIIISIVMENYLFEIVTYACTATIIIANIKRMNYHKNRVAT